MASTRKTQRSRSTAGELSTSPMAKRKSSSSPFTNCPAVESEASELSEKEIEVNSEPLLEMSHDMLVDAEEEIVSVDDTDVKGIPLDDDPSNTEPAEEEACSVAEEVIIATNISSASIDQSEVEETSSEPEKPAPVFVFKDPNFVHSNKGAGGNKRTRVWKNLKQIVAAERLLPWGPDDVTYGSIDAPPSFKPAKKYSDISGLESKYTDPQTKMRYATTDEYHRIRMLPGDIVTGCLALRKANTMVP